MQLADVTVLAFYVDTWWGGHVVFLKNFPLQRLHFIPLEAVQDFDLHLSAWLCLLFLLVRE